MKVAVVGAGRMGLPLACALGKNGATVDVSDVNETLVEQIGDGICPYDEPGLPELIGTALEGRLAATTDTVQAASRSEVRDRHRSCSSHAGA